MALGKNVKALREKRGWTLKDLSKLSGVPVGTIGAIEVRDSVRSEYAVRLAQGLGVDVSELMDGDFSPKPSPPSTSQTSRYRLLGVRGGAMDLGAAIDAVAAAMMQTDPVDRAAAKAYLMGLCDAPDRLDLRDKIRATLEPPPAAQKPTPETGAKRAA